MSSNSDMSGSEVGHKNQNSESGELCLQSATPLQPITSKNKKQTNKKTLSFCIYKRESQGFIKYLEHHTEGWAQEIKPMKLCMKHWIHPNFDMHWYYLNNHNKFCDNWPTSMTEGEHRWCETRADLKINEKNMKNKLILKSQPIERW